METYTARQVRSAAGVSSELLDYWHRTGLLAPVVAGSYTAHEMSLAIILAEAARLGTAGPQLAALALALDGEFASWPTDLWLDADGTLRDADDAPAAVVLHVRRVLAHAAPQLHAALTAA